MIKRKKIIIAASFLMIGFLIWLGIYLPKGGSEAQETTFKIEKGDSSRDIALALQNHGLIIWGPFFRVYVLLAGTSADLQAGSYLLSPSMNIPQIARKLSLGEVARVKITIPEGFSAKQIYQKLKDITAIDEVLLGKQEGYLFPDTYEIPYGLAQDKIIQMMLDNFNQKTINLKITPEIITMASLIEKEVRTKEDKELVSGILWKRLRAGMPLQVDATINYITNKQTVKISKEDTRIDSPYNTYLRKELPAGPISNPGLESIVAAINPKNSLYWYYLSTPEGKTIFSKILDEHNAAKAKYLNPQN